LRIPVKKAILSRMNILEVEAGTNGYHGGDSGGGSRTYLALRDRGATTWRLRVRDRCGKDWIFEQPVSVEITVGGDSELDTFLDALKFSAQALTDLLRLEHADKPTHDVFHDVEVE